MTWEVVQKMLENAWFMSCSPFPGCQVVGWILILVSIPNCSLSYSDYDTVDGSEILVQKSCTTWHVHETLQKMGHLPYQLAQDFWTINSSWEFCHSTTRISFRYSFRCGSIWVNRPASFKVADLFSIHFWKHAATDVTNGIFVPNLQFFWNMFLFLSLFKRLLLEQCRRPSHSGTVFGSASEMPLWKVWRPSTLCWRSRAFTMSATPGTESRATSLDVHL